jgi:hypothetical protein
VDRVFKAYTVSLELYDVMHPKSRNIAVKVDKLSNNFNHQKVYQNKAQKQWCQSTLYIALF